MNEPNASVRSVSDTAHWMAYYPASEERRLDACSVTRSGRIVWPAEPGFAPIDEFVARTSPEGHMGTATHGAFEVHSVAELPHLSRAIHNKFLDPFDHPALLTAEQALVGRKPQPTVVSRLIQGCGDAPH